MTLSKQLKRAITATKETRYRVAKDSGVGYATLMRFLDENRDIRLSTVEALAKYLNLELKPARKAKKQQKS